MIQSTELSTEPQLRMIWPEQRLATPPILPLPAGYVLRTSQPGDEEPFFALMALAGWPGWNAEKLHPWLIRMLPDGGFVIIHAASNTLVASAMALRDCAEFGIEGGELGWLAVDPAHTGQGLGAIVSAAVTRRFLEHGYRHIHLYTESRRLAALKTYLKLGYVAYLDPPAMPAVQERWHTIHQQLARPFAAPVLPTGTPPAEFDLDTAFVARLLADQHPDLADLPLQIVDAGWDNAMFRLGDHLSVRLPRRAAAADLITHEQTWLPRLADHLTLPIPAPYRIGTPADGYPWNWSILPWLTGVAADQSEPYATQARPFAAFLRSLHRPAPADAPANPVRGVPLEQRAAVVEARMQRLATSTSLITPTIQRIWQEALAAPIDIPPTWLHGDLHPRNVLVEAGIITGIIDWGDITSGDCATDLAAIWMLFADANAHQQALSAYTISYATMQRAKGWAILFGVVLLETGLADNPRNALIGERTLCRVAASNEF